MQQRRQIINFGTLLNFQRYLKLVLQIIIMMNQSNSTHTLEDQNVYWSQHKITLVGHEMKFVKSLEREQTSSPSEDPKHKKTTKKQNFQSGFLSYYEQSSVFFDVQQVVKDYPQLSKIFSETETSLELKKLFLHMLELKHSIVVREFCLLYDLILIYIDSIQPQQMIKENNRTQLIQEVRGNVMKQMEKIQQKFPLILQLMKKDYIGFKKYILVTVYCIVAQKFNFHFNEYYQEVFEGNEEPSTPCKRVKK